MKKIKQGKYEIFTEKEDAINKFMQLQGICNEEISGENAIEFYCYKNGKIIITNPPRSKAPENSTNLCAEIVEEGEKIYVTYYTGFSKFNNVFKIIFYTINALITVFAIVLAVTSMNITASLIILALAVAFFGFELSNASKEAKNSPKDSEILIKELEKRVNAVNLWDK